MTFFAGVVATDSGRPSVADLRILDGAAQSFGGAPGSCWSGPGCALVHVQRIYTPEDRDERFPLVHADGRKVLVLDGRLDNRDQLIANLSLPAAARSQPDGALLAAAIERWGDDVCRHLRGDFAFAAWDVAERRLLLACDQLGGRSLYLHAAGDRLYFATVLNAVLAFPDVPRGLDEVTLAHALRNHMPPAVGRTPYAAIAMLPSASRLTWRDGAWRQERYWHADPTTRIRFRRDQDYVEAARELLDQAVRERLRAEGPVVCYLSGGLDSSGVSATAARLLAPGTLHTVTQVPDPSSPLPRPSRFRYLDEWPNAQAVAALYPNIQAHRVPASLEDENEEGYFHLVGWPIRQVFNVQWLACMRPVIQNLGARVVLNGQPGNATLSYDGLASLPDRVLALRLVGVARDIIGFQRNLGAGLSKLRSFVLRPLAPPWVLRQWHKAKGGPPRFSLANPGFAAARALEDTWDYAAPELAGAPPGERAVRTLVEHWCHGRAIRSAFRAIEGFEARSPLGDLRLLEFCLAIPPEQYLRDGQTRFLARRTLADRLPPQVVNDYRMGKQNPEWFTWMTRRRDSLLADLAVLETSPTAAKVLDLPRARKLLTDWPADAEAGEARWADLQAALGRGFRVGRFIRWAEGARA